MLQTHLNSLLCGFKIPMPDVCNPRFTAVHVLYLHLIFAVELRKLGFEVSIDKGYDLFRSLRGDEAGKIDKT